MPAPPGVKRLNRALSWHSILQSSAPQQNGPPQRNGPLTLYLYTNAHRNRPNIAILTQFCVQSLNCFNLLHWCLFPAFFCSPGLRIRFLFCSLRHFITSFLHSHKPSSNHPSLYMLLARLPSSLRGLGICTTCLWRSIRIFVPLISLPIRSVNYGDSSKGNS
jgi:hypothetical protein